MQGNMFVDMRNGLVLDVDFEDTGEFINLDDVRCKDVSIVELLSQDAITQIEDQIQEELRDQAEYRRLKAKYGE